MQLRGAPEHRPELRNQGSWDLRCVDYLPRFDAALHADYRFFHDDWGINAHTIELSWHQALGGGWMLVPGTRYYMQSRAAFYQPYFLFDQAYPALPGLIFPGAPRLLDFSQIKARYFASDERLSAFGSLGGRLALRKQFSKSGRLAIGGEYTVHAGALKPGGGEASFADFEAWTVDASLAVDRSAPGAALGPQATPRDERPLDLRRTPAGVRFDHLLAARGTYELSYHFDYDMQSGTMRHHDRRVIDQHIIDHDCGAGLCAQTPRNIASQVSSIELLYGLSSWSNLLLTADLVTHDEELRALEPRPQAFVGIYLPAAPSFKRNTGGWGDTGWYRLLGLLDREGEHLHAGFGLSAPTGDAARRLSGTHAYNNFGAQSGSGTWDFHPSLTYTGAMMRLSWGAQLNGIKRLEHRNSAGFTRGDSLQATSWGSFRLCDWLSASIRGVYTNQGAVDGTFKRHFVPQVIGTEQQGTETVAIYADELQSNSLNGPMDDPRNYGGKFWDVGFGVNAVFQTGLLRGHRISVEWIEPVGDRANGDQLARDGSLRLAWELAL